MSALYEVAAIRPGSLRKCYFGRFTTLEAAEQRIQDLKLNPEPCTHPQRHVDYVSDTLDAWERYELGGDSIG